MIAALLVAAELAGAAASRGGVYLRESADTWNDNLEYWTYVEETELARQLGVPGYYLRVGPPDDEASHPSTTGT